MLLDFHIIFIFAAGAAVLYADEEALSWVLGQRERLSAKKLEWLHGLVGAALAGLIATGGLLFLRAPSFYLAQPAFVAKLVFVASLIVNGFFIARLSLRDAGRSWAELSERERQPLLISGVISLTGWGGALLCGLRLH